MQMICEHCGHVGEPVKHAPGSSFIGLALLLCGFVMLFLFQVIGIALLFGWVAYGIWRLIAKKEVCPSCRSAGAMLPTDSPRGKKLCSEYAASTDVRAEAVSPSVGT
jgi:hypothetical protein